MMKIATISGFHLRREEPRYAGIHYSEERYKALADLILYLQKEEAGLLLIAGNLFDVPPTLEMLEELDKGFSNVEGLPILLAPGSCEESEAYQNYSWKNRVHVFSVNKAERIYIKELNLEVTGIGASKEYEKRVEKRIRTCGKRAVTQILLLPEKCPLSSKVLSRFTICFYGNEKKDAGEKAPNLFAPGNALPTGFVHETVHGFFLTEIKDRKVQSNAWLKSPCREMISLDIQVTEKTEYPELIKEIQKTISTLGNKNIYELHLNGTASPELFLRKNELKKAGYISAVRNEMDETKAEEKLKKDESLKAVSLFVNDILPEDELSEKAYSYGLEALFAKKEGRI